MDNPGFEIPRPQYSSREQYTIVPNFPPEDPRASLTKRDGSPGDYRVIFTLAMPGKEVFATELNLSLELTRGDSLVAFGANRTEYQVEVRQEGKAVGGIILGKNQAGRLATALVIVKASSFIEAQKTAYEIIAPFLSFLSFTSDVGIEIAGYQIIELVTQSLMCSWGAMGEVKSMTIPSGYERFISNKTTRRLLAAYREGMNAGNVFYQALSFSKVIEGMSNVLARDPVRKALRFPTDMEDLKLKGDQIPELFARFLGKKFSWAREYFRPLIRNAIAHLDPSSDTLDIDHFADVNVCERAIPVLRYMARSLLDDYLGLVCPIRR